jgi:NADH:ubiquinone oxidoreductase subunit 2 (subunit N)
MKYSPCSRALFILFTVSLGYRMEGAELQDTAIGLVKAQMCSAIGILIALIPITVGIGFRVLASLVPFHQK